jgi:hypothetical protein
MKQPQYLHARLISYCFITFFCLINVKISFMRKLRGIYFVKWCLNTYPRTSGVFVLPFEWCNIPFFFSDSLAPLAEWYMRPICSSKTERKKKKEKKKKKKKRKKKLARKTYFSQLNSILF